MTPVAKPMPDTIILIPARMASTRLPGKPLADIGGLPMIVHVLRRALAAKIGEAVVATDSEAVAAAVEKAGGRAVMTRADHVSGSDRIYEALEALDPERRIGMVVNVQGDLPTIDPADIRAALGSAGRSRRRYRDARRGDHRSGRAEQSERGEGDRHAGRARPFARHDVHPRQRHRAGPALSPHRALRLSARGAGAFRQAAAVGQRAAREARAVARARCRHAHRCRAW